MYMNVFIRIQLQLAFEFMFGSVDYTNPGNTKAIGRRFMCKCISMSMSSYISASVLVCVDMSM
jgi:hypothetical protein